MPLRLALDFNGVCHNPNDIEPGYKLGKPIPGTVEALWKLKHDGALIVIHSAWADSEQRVKAISEWMNFFKLPYDFITNRKPQADFYISAQGIRFESWAQTLQELEERKVS